MADYFRTTLREAENMVVKNSMLTFKRVLSLMFAETNKYFLTKMLSSCLSMNSESLNLIRLLFRYGVGGYKFCVSYRFRVSIVEFQIS